jgi:hypothetical protein
LKRRVQRVISPAQAGARFALQLARRDAAANVAAPASPSAPLRPGSPGEKTRSSPPSTRQPFRRRLPFPLHPAHEAPGRSHTHRPSPPLALVPIPSDELPRRPRWACGHGPWANASAHPGNQTRLSSSSPAGPFTIPDAAGRRFPVQRTLT